MTDHQLIQAFLHGDLTEQAEAIRHVYTQTDWRAQVSAAVRQMGGTEDDAADVFTEAMLILRRRLQSGEFRGEAKLGTFFNGIARQYWYGQRRKAAGHAEKLNQIDTEMNEPAPDRMLIDKERDAALHEAIALLSDTCRQVLLLGMKGLSGEEIAQQVGFDNANVVKTKALKCRKRLEEIIRQSSYFTETLNIRHYGKK
ncbi:MAG: RNA polymerase sigma factor [Saprospiraceae bacterium]|nr:RNA polymerase sigma factor [Saprospiraceae bacterium]